MSKVFYKGGVNSQLTRLIPIIIVLITFIASMISLLFGLEEENRKKYIIYSIAPLIINICIIIGITAICELQYRKTDKNLSEYTESVVVERSIYHMIRYVNENEKMFPYTYSKGDNLIVICSLPKDTELKSTGDTIKIEGEEYLEIYYPKINVEGYIPYNVVKEQEEYYSE